MDRRRALAWISFVFGCAVSSAHACPDLTPLTALLSRGQDLYLGEVHGTAETPMLVACLVESAASKQFGPLIVSLELPESARDPGSEFWRGMDGRSSKAMWELVRFLIGQEEKGLLSLHFQDRSGAFVGPATRDEQIGRALRALAQEGLLIALSGNFHSRREPVETMPDLKPAGMYAGPDITRISIEPVEDGDAWVCMGAPPCRVQPMARTPIENARVGAAVDGAVLGHDLIYFVERFTASAPAFGAN